VTLDPIPETWTRALAVVAHPDDLEYGAASAIARWTASGRSIGYVIVTDGEAGIEDLPRTARRGSPTVGRRHRRLPHGRPRTDPCSRRHRHPAGRGRLTAGAPGLPRRPGPRLRPGSCGQSPPARDEGSALSTPSPSAAFNSRGSDSRCSTLIAPPFAAARPTPTRMRCVVRAPHPNEDRLRSLLSRPR
jgi:hypothetical protein